MIEISQAENSNADESHSVDTGLCGRREVELKGTRIEKAEGLSALLVSGGIEVVQDDSES